MHKPGMGGRNARAMRVVSTVPPGQMTLRVGRLCEPGPRAARIAFRDLAHFAESQIFGAISRTDS